MKKLLLMIASAFMLSTNLWAWELVPLSVYIDDDEKPIGHSTPKTPIETPKGSLSVLIILSMFLILRMRMVRKSILQRFSLLSQMSFCHLPSLATMKLIL